jgi:hypothetical protein
VSAVRWLVVGALLLAALPAAAQDTLTDLEINGASDNRIDLLIMGDGYTAAEQEALVADATSMADSIFGFSPFTPYRPFFNFYVIESVSNESGADHPTESLYADTAFGCAFDCMGLDRLICCDDGAVMGVADSLLPEHDAIVLMVNDSEYGGSGGYYAVVSMNELAAEVVTHEFGHSLAGLGDEYADAYPGFVFTDIYPNVSPTADRDLLKWTDFVDADTPLPTLESDATGPLAPVGAYEGACYQATGLFRPVAECLMRNISNGFCPVCAEALVLSYYGFVEIIDSSAPVGDAVSGAAGDTLEFSVDAVEAVPSTVAYRWKLDDTWIDTPEASLSLPIECLTQGEHTLTAEVRDDTALVINDPESLLVGSRSWTATRTDDGAVVEDCFDEEPVDTDSETGGDTDTDSDMDADSDSDGDSDSDSDGDGDGDGDTDSDSDSDGTGKSDDGCGCAEVGGRRTTPSFLRAVLPTID